MRFDWPPDVVYDLDPDFLKQLLARLDAQAAYDKAQQKKKKKPKPGGRFNIGHGPGEAVDLED